MNSSTGSVGAGLKIKVADKFILGIDYDLTFAKKYRSHALTGIYGVGF